MQGYFVTRVVGAQCNGLHATMLAQLCFCGVSWDAGAKSQADGSTSMSFYEYLPLAAAKSRRCDTGATLVRWKKCAVPWERQLLSSFEHVLCNWHYDAGVQFLVGNRAVYGHIEKQHHDIHSIVTLWQMLRQAPWIDICANACSTNQK